MKRFIFPVLLIISYARVDAQGRGADSLLQLVQTTQNDTLKCLLLAKLQRAYVYNNPDTAMLLVQQGLLLAKKEKFLKGEAVCLTAKGNILDITGNYPDALQCAIQALQINEQLNNCDQGENKKAIGYLLQAKAIHEKLANRTGVLIDLVNLGDNYEHATILDSARTNNQQGYELALKLNDVDAAGIALENLGNVYTKMSLVPLALDYYRLALNNYKQEDDDEGISQTTIAMAKLFMKTNHNDSALYYAKQSLAIGVNGKYFPDILEASNLLSGYFKNVHQYDSAFVYQEMVISAKDSLFSEEKVKEVQKLSYDEQQRQQEMAEQKIKEKETTKRNLQLAGIAVFIPTFCLFVLFLSRRKVKSRTIEFFGIVALLMIFEFITLLIHPFVETWTDDAPVLMLAILVAVAAILVPVHHKLEEWIKEKLAHGSFATVTEPTSATERNNEIIKTDIE